MRPGYISLEFALLLPIVLFVFSVAAQFFALSQSRIYVQQAAYAAARSALVHKCPPAGLTDLLENPILSAVAPCSDTPSKWEDAARWHLVPAAPASEFAMSRENCPALPAAESLMAATPMPRDLADAFQARLCYAFEPENVEVNVAWDTSGAGRLSRNGRVAITATVRFRYPLTTPIGFFLADGEREDGTRWRWGSASVVMI